MGGGGRNCRLDFFLCFRTRRFPSASFQIDVEVFIYCYLLHVSASAE